MKFTALIQETTVRTIRVIVDAESKGQAKRLLTAYAVHGKYVEGIVASKRIHALPLFDSIEPLTPESNDRIQRELRQ